ncbi:hypothetical protein [Lactovum miscens]|uniref:hypothetical protein n=1 Tax=Lactovum miscens TaxID=190387 RepID=UPI002ED89A5B
MFDIDVCKTALIRTLQIGQGRLDVALKKLSSESFVDGRGKAISGWNKFPSAKRQEVRNHISSFPRYVSHYTRNQTKSKFLHSSLNLAIMYRLYKEKFQNPVIQSYYKKVFYEDFNLRFKVPKKDKTPARSVIITLLDPKLPLELIVRFMKNGTKPILTVQTF